jgi:shikimate dehydrogenase
MARDVANGISGAARVLPIFGWPVEQVKAPTLFNAYFAKHGFDAVVVPMGVAPEQCVDVMKAMLRAGGRAGNCDGALVTIPHKTTVAHAMDTLSERARIADSCNGVARRPDGSLHGDLTDGEGFVRGLDRAAGGKGFDFANSSALVVGAGGVGKANACALAARGIRRIGLFDTSEAMAKGLRDRLKEFYPRLVVDLVEPDVKGFDMMVNCTPLGMAGDDPLPAKLEGLLPSTIVADCVMKVEITPLLKAAQARGCRIQRGREMLLEQAPLYMELFGWNGTTAADFRALGVI